MRAVWSFWSKPFLAFKGRVWLEPLHHLLAWGLSVRLASKHYPDTMLVTDQAGAELLVERLGLRFTHVRTDLEQLRHADVGWWALGKLFAYSVQDRPFVHLDTDVFLWKQLPARLEGAAVFSNARRLTRRSTSGAVPVTLKQPSKRTTWCCRPNGNGRVRNPAWVFVRKTAASLAAPVSIS